MPAPSCGQERRDRPGGLALLNRGQPAQIHRIEQDSANVDQAQAEGFCDLRDDLGFADAGRSPEEGRLLDPGQQLQRRGDIGRLHGDLHDGPPGSLSPRPDPSRISPPPSYSPGLRRHRRCSSGTRSNRCTRPGPLACRRETAERGVWVPRSAPGPAPASMAASASSAADP